MDQLTSSNRAIGILDSGVGGLTVVKEVFRQLPRETVLYFGDTRRCPYGPRSTEEVRQFTLEIVRFLMRFPLKALVIACNTATAAALELIREQVDIPVLGVIEPGARAAIKASKNGRIGVIGTQGTIQSAAYEKTLKRIHPDLFVVSHACPALVPLVESGVGPTEQAYRVVETSLAPMKGQDVDSLILGCTHYPLIADLIGKVMGEQVTLISSAEETARELSVVLNHKRLLADREQPAGQVSHQFFTSGEPEGFRQIAERWLGMPIKVEQAELEPVVTTSVSGV
ncbi:glutamate racemase [Polycladomyces subterraneus]|uniref:Glutamate racemase n=1 Tax=Polycladomyces subterraneus TaxID=1016997 RepID=A0ABT8IIP4_9BACL|nr:glutamate racemase [Polycladomyces subterraneus]MDN4592653.1 glutamate racemase [Polycladomyces subterraneus]